RRGRMLDEPSGAVVPGPGERPTDTVPLRTHQVLVLIAVEIAGPQHSGDPIVPGRGQAARSLPEEPAGAIVQSDPEIRALRAETAVVGKTIAVEVGEGKLLELADGRELLDCVDEPPPRVVVEP